MKKIMKVVFVFFIALPFSRAAMADCVNTTGRIGAIFYGGTVPVFFLSTDVNNMNAQSINPTYTADQQKNFLSLIALAKATGAQIEIVCSPDGKSVDLLKLL